MKRIVVIAAALLAGCASVPKELPVCERPGAYLVVYEGKQYALFDVENLHKLRARMTGLRDGTCREE